MLVKATNVKKSAIAARRRIFHDHDTWQLTLQDLLKVRFKDGDNIGNYIDVAFIKLEDKYVARIQVASRSRLSFLKGKDRWHLYRRDGNRTLEVTIDQVEEFISLRSIQEA